MAQSTSSALPAIEHDSRLIRLIELEAATNDDTLRAQFRVCPLESDVYFVALSYEWGADPASKTLAIDGHCLMIRENLWLALYQILTAQDGQRSELKESLEELAFSPCPLIWVDAICIDQTNVEERNHQVTMMQDIYMRAVAVLVWLGPERDDSELAVWHISRRGRFLEGRPHDAGAIHSLLWRTYWTRLWIVQEFILGARVLLLCGDEVFLWQSLDEAIGVIVSLDATRDSSQPPRQPIESSPGFKVVQGKRERIEAGKKLYGHYTSPYSLDYLILRWSNQQCKDNRDKVFALIGLPFHDFQWKRGSIVVDYKKSVEELYCDVLSSLKYTIGTLDEAQSFCVNLAIILEVDMSNTIVCSADAELATWFKGYYRLKDVEQ